MDVELIHGYLTEYTTTSNKQEKKKLQEKIVKESMQLVKKIAKSLARRSTDPIEDLMQVGSVGLLKAIDQFDASFGANFKTYSTCLITGEIRHYLRDKTSMIKAPRELQELSFRINQLIIRLSEKLGREPTNVEIAEELEVSVQRVVEAHTIDRRKQMISLDQVVHGQSEGEQLLVDRIIDSKYNDYLLTQEDRIMLADAIECLDPVMQEVIKMSYFEDLSQSEIAKVIGVSQMQVSRRLKKAVSTLFNILNTQTKIQVKTY